MVRQIWEQLLDSDRMCRHYEHLVQRPSRVGNWLKTGTVCASSGPVIAYLAPLPVWIPRAAVATTAVAIYLLAIRRYREKAARSADIDRQMARIQAQSETRLTGHCDTAGAQPRYSAWSLAPSGAREALAQASRNGLAADRSLRRVRPGKPGPANSRPHEPPHRASSDIRRPRAAPGAEPTGGWPSRRVRARPAGQTP